MYNLILENLTKYSTWFFQILDVGFLKKHFDPKSQQNLLFSILELPCRIRAFVDILGVRSSFLQIVELSSNIFLPGSDNHFDGSISMEIRADAAIC
ncbi:hypothetical protein BLA29_001038 [Euroglyphus maynei]|uniref:Uncharacterized protein n=1 Tax=Euroglyphus maynei TaxID=6958 RepID=A0A1Y3AXW5_EURMA|nr:hypothetical protein BLA29_001038 [Euroglyphus maynei]